jgi:hypothetical protein
MVLYLDGRGKANGMTADGDITKLVELGYAVFAIDVSGTGEIAFARNQSAPWSSPQVSFLALMVGKPMMGIRMNDIARGLDALQEIGALPGDGVLGFAKGRLGPVLLHAAVVDKRITGAIVENALVSYSSVGSAAIHREVDDMVVPGVLGQYDFADLVAAMAPARVWITNAHSPTGKLLLKHEVEAAYNYGAQAYKAAGHPGNFKIGLRRESEPIVDSYPDLR